MKATQAEADAAARLMDEAHGTAAHAAATGDDAGADEWNELAADLAAIAASAGDDGPALEPSAPALRRCGTRLHDDGTCTCVPDADDIFADDGVES